MGVVLAGPAFGGGGSRGPSAAAGNGRSWDWRKLLGLWLENDLGTPQEFLHQTPRLLTAHLDAVARRRKRENLERHWLAYHAGVYSRDLQPYPKWAEIVAQINGETPKPMTAEQVKAVRSQWRVARAWEQAERIAAGVAPPETVSQQP